MKYATLILAAILLVGCQSNELSVVDQCMRREIFQQCMKALPAGPQTTKYNDWGEVVSQCESVAYYQSLRKRKFIKPECQT